MSEPGTDTDAVEITNKRKQLRCKITRTINRVKQSISKGEDNSKRFRKELEQLRRDYDVTSDLHGQLYDLLDETHHVAMDKWEGDLANAVFAIEEEVEDYLAALVHVSASQAALGADNNASAGNVASNSSVQQGGISQPEQQQQQSSFTPQLSPVANSAGQPVSRSFDAWIDDLVEFQETVLQEQEPAAGVLTVADALFKLEASRDIPSVKLPQFDGSALSYPDFIDRFKIHIHDKKHLKDDMRMIQLKMHVVGEAERAISGFGSKGVMYATALKTLKEQFGQPTHIARSVINKLTKGERIQKNNRQALREFSLDIINSLATIQQIKYDADLNANDNLRKIVLRLPEHLVQKWKFVAADIREKGQVPTLQHISDFVRKRVKAEFDPDFGDLEKEVRSQKNDSGSGNVRERRGIHAAQRNPSKTKCYVCEGEHKVPDCPTLADCNTKERFDAVKSARLCFSCLNKGHMTRDCRSRKRCEKNGCNRFHHPLLHTDPPTASGVASVLDRNSILPVVRVRFRAANGRVREGNALIDSGAGTTVIRRDFAKALGLQGKRERIDLAVVGGERVEQPKSRRVSFWISALEGSEEFKIEAHEIEKTILSVPALNRQWLKSFSHLRDVDFPHKAGPVDLILGVQYSHLHAEDETRQGLPFEPVGKKTKLGWFAIGSDNQSRKPTICSISFVQPMNLEKFYQLETLGVQAPDCSCPRLAISRDDRKAMELMEASCERQGTRYTIGLPWKKDKCLLPNNYALAERRLLSQERSLLKNETKAKMYEEVLLDYQKNGWARPLSKQELEADTKPVYYLPHHGIYRPEKKSTPLRIVFDPACQFQGVSLNSFLHKGPGLIGDLLGVLLRFREDPVAFVGDISKMFLQIRLPEEDTHVHRFLWRNLDQTRKPTVYALQRVTFGDKPSPDMASFVMLKIAKDNEADNPDAAVILRRDRYMDDLIHSCQTSEEAIQRTKQLDRVLATGSFIIKEWLYSSGVVQDELTFGAEVKESDETKSDAQERNASQSQASVLHPEATKSETSPSPVHRETGRMPEQDAVTSINLDGEKGIKTLGVGWNPHTDMLNFAVKDIKVDKLTKRTVLSSISKLYDPLGLASAVTIKSKIALQDIWRANQYDWDDPLPDEMRERWTNLFREVEKLKSVRFPRCLQPETVSGPSELHVFADASGAAYGAVAYLMWPTPNGPEVQLVSAKARVAPLRQTTIPRLELMAALVASRLAKVIHDEFKTKPSSVTLWSDSKIVLHWLRSESAALKAFVGVRVTEIQSTWDPSSWKYVPTSLNPADDLSRGILVEEMNSGRWKNGPSFLKRSKDEWPVEDTEPVQHDPERKKTKAIGAVSRTTPLIDPQAYSSWTRLTRVTAYALRFLNNMKASRDDRSKHQGGPLQPSEITFAERFWIVETQRDLGNWEKKHHDLNPFVEDAVVRVGGRLRRSDLTYDQVHPILLPAENHISKLIMEDIHQKLSHAGCERTLSESRRQYWIVRGRNLAKCIARNCTVCRKLRQPPHTTLMADLPPERMKPFSPPFTVTGVDLFGPFNLKITRNKSAKAWGALFTCATARAIHLEIVENLSSEAFLQALRRFASYHGWPTTIISDNGKSFVGAEKELRKLVVEGRKQLEDYAVLHKMRWMFTTPLSPHQGGIYESLIKQTKRALRVAVGAQVLSWNEMATVFAEVKTLVNSRPLGYASNDPNDPQPLTPNHFILGRASSLVPQGPFEESRNPRRRFQFVQSLAQHFWRRFIREYVPTLMRRAKWQSTGRQMSVGDIVLLVDYNAPRGKWDLARVQQVFPGSDGVIRNVQVKTKNGEYKRSIQKCCVIHEAK